jgi:diaminopimelate epimerase
MRLHFTKMHGLGNDFMIVRWPAELAPPGAATLRSWADRRRGVGFDQLVLVEPARPVGADAAYRVFNADGTEAEQSGNGVRCLARYLRAHDAEASLRLRSAAGVVEALLLANGDVSVNLGVPDFRPASLPFTGSAEQERYEVRLSTGIVVFGAVSLGNPHAVIAVDSVDDAAVGILGPELAALRCFPNSVNVGFMQVESERRIRLRVYERGAGETQACGTGAAAATAVGRRWGKLAQDVEVAQPGGILNVRWPAPGAPLWLTGPATFVYEGELSYEPTEE